jgi:hypothetical protein
MIRGLCGRSYVFTHACTLRSLRNTSDPYQGLMLTKNFIARSMQYLCEVMTAGLFYEAAKLRKELGERPSHK